MSDYTLFTDNKHDDIRWTYTQDKIDRVIELWDQGLPYSEIGVKLRLKKIEVMLILIDLSDTGKLKQRRGGLLG